tara:strand:- start:378 stop:800 length:423 start_codon:yes stop_codon:yes gene_type:complete
MLSKSKLSLKIIGSLLCLSFLAILVAPVAVNAEIPMPNDPSQKFGLGTEQNFKNVGLGQSEDLKGSIANIINIILGFLGIVAVIIILAGGFKWMTAGGNEDKVAEARQMVIQGVIGLVIVFAAWAIASFVVGNLLTATQQ